MKNLLVLGLAGLFMVLCALTILSQAREKMKVVCWGPYEYWAGDHSHWRNFAQIDSCFMNTLDVGKYTQADFDSNANYEFKLIEYLDRGSPITVGQQSIYEADNKYYLHLQGFTPDYFDGYFSESNRVGEEKLDVFALNGYTWYAEPDSYEAGYVMRGLKDIDVSDLYNNEQGIPKAWSKADTITFYADFLIKISDTTYQADPFLVLKAIRIDQPDTFLLDSLVVFPQDFDYPNQYQTFELIFDRDSTEKGRLDYNVWWDGSREVWIDRVEIRDAFADSLFRGLYDERIDTLKAQRGGYLEAWSSVDEPAYDQIASQAYIFAYLGSTPYGLQNFPFLDFMDEYMGVANPKELWLQSYPLKDTTDTASTGGNLQSCLSATTDVLHQAKSKAISYGKPLVYIAQAFEDTSDTTDPIIRWRYPTEFEQKVVAWLGLAHGANGIAYFTYATRDGIKGLADCRIDSGDCEPHEPNWSAVQSVNAIIDSIGWLFADTSSWKGAGGGDTVASIPGSYIDTLKSAEFASPWIEVGFFEDSASTDYFMLVNRRCLSTEEQSVTVYMDNASLIPDKKMWYVIDQYSQDTTFTGAINGVIPFTTHLDPGEGKLFKLVP